MVFLATPLPVLMLVLTGTLLTGEVRGDACQDKTLHCIQTISSAASGVANLFLGSSPDVNALLTQCQVVQGLLATCERELRSLCPAPAANSTLSQLRRAYTAACGPEATCSFRVSRCNVEVSVVGEITEALQQNPPDVAYVTDKCRVLNASVAPCVEQLKADCGSVSGMAQSISAITSSFNSLCGKEGLCRLQMGKCQSVLVNLGSAGEQNDLAQLCRAQQSARQCLYMKVDAQCMSMPEWQQILSSFNSSSAICSDEAMQCPQVWQCLNRRGDENDGDCSVLPRSMMECLADLKGQCQVKEDRITFKELETRSLQICQEMKKSAGQSMSCSALGECMMKSDLMRKIYAEGSTASAPKINLALVLDSQMWCQYLDLMAGCYIGSVDKCPQLDTPFLSYITEQHKHLSSICPSYGEKQAAGNLLLILLVAVFTAWARPSL